LQHARWTVALPPSCCGHAAGATRAASAITCARVTLGTSSCQWWSTTLWSSGVWGGSGRAAAGAAVRASNTPALPHSSCNAACILQRPRSRRLNSVCCLAAPCCVCPCSMLYRLLKNTCLNCHQFKMGRQEVRQ
jgi:hypothetical protein